MTKVATRDAYTRRVPKSQLPLSAANIGGLFRGQVPIVARLNSSGGSNGTITGVTTHMNRFVMPVMCDAFDVRVVYALANAYAAAPNDLDIEAWLEMGPETAFNTTWTAAVDDGIAVPFTFQADVKRTVKAAARFIVSDPLPYVVKKGTHIAVHTRVGVAGGGTIPSNRGGLAAYGDALASDATALAVAAPGTFYGAASSGAMFVPVAVIGTPINELPSSIVGLGDSITNGSGDNRSFATPEASTGYFERAVSALGLPFVNLGTGGKKASDLVAYGSLGAALTMPMIAGNRLLLAAMGRNDLAGLGTLAALQADLISEWIMAGASGVPVAQDTITVRSQSTDLFETTGNQSAHALSNEAVRTGLNDWLRDGAPMIGLAPVGAGSSGATVARCDVYNSAGVKVVNKSGPAHLLKAVIDVASTVESAMNSGKWKAAKWVGTGDTHSNTAVDNIVTVSGAIDQYDNVISTAGGIATGRYITTALAGGAFTLNGAATATQVAARIIAAWTDDGLHPNRIGHIAMAACLVAALPQILAS